MQYLILEEVKNLWMVVCPYCCGFDVKTLPKEKEPWVILKCNNCKNKFWIIRKELFEKLT